MKNKKTKNLLITNIEIPIIKKTAIKTQNTAKKTVITKLENDRISTLETTIFDMQNNFTTMMKSLSEKIEKPTAQPKQVKELKTNIKEKNKIIVKKNKELIRKNKLIEKTKKIIEKQNAIMKQDEKVKQDMGQKLQDVLLELNRRRNC